MNNLNNAIALYGKRERLESLKIEYALSEDSREKFFISIALKKLGYKVMDNVNLF